jgi:pyruvate/2-oxoglutarate dehydrogenase complex dihydrolipoamide dehydrogenase (E3) component
MVETHRYDAVIIGDGQAGGPLSTALVKSGRRTAVVERKHAGGTCINEGCTPTKTMVASARVAYLAKRASDFGIRAPNVSVDMVGVRRRKREIVESFRTGSQRAVEEGGAEYFKGDARFLSRTSVEVALEAGGRVRLDAGNTFINAGCRPAIPPLPGLHTVPYLDSTSIMELADVPDHLVILGGGYVAVEFGQMFRRFGSRVTMIELGPQLLGHEDRDISEAVVGILREDGIEILLQTSAVGVRAEANGVVSVSVDAAPGTVTGSHMLVATGRTPNTETLDCAAAGIALTDSGYIVVNDRLETTTPGIYALGDVAGTPAFTHMAYDDFRILRTNLVDGGNRTTAGRLVPYTVFIDPQLGRVGHTEASARDKCPAVKVATMPMTRVARAVEVDESRGLVKVVVDGESDLILGAAVLGLEGGEIMAMLEIAIMGNVPYTALRDGIFSHPTLAELFNRLFEVVE